MQSQQQQQTKTSPHVFVEQTDVVDDLMPSAWSKVPKGMTGEWWCVSNQLAAAAEGKGEVVVSNGMSFWWYVPEALPEARIEALELHSFLG